MSRPLLALAALLLVLGSLARLSCEGSGQTPVTPEAPAEESATGGPADLIVPGGSAAERGLAAPLTEAAAEPEAGTVDELPVLLTGLVIDGGGAGVPDATVQVERHTEDAGGIGMRTVHVQQLPELTVSTDTEGRFVVRGEEEGAVVVKAVKDAYVLREEVACTLPATRVTLVMERSGAILATVAPEALDLADKLYVEVRPMGGTGNALGAFREGRALRQGLLPGSYDVVLVERVSRRPVLTVTGVSVREGQTTQDPRLQDIDLRAVTEKVRVTVVDHDDQPLPGVTVWVHHGSGESGRRTGDDGSIELGVPRVSGVDVAVREPGWRRVRHQGVVQDLVIRLERPLALRLLRPEGRSSALGDMYLYVERVLPEGVRLTGQDTSDWSLAADEDAVEIALDAAGVYRVKWAAKFDFAGRGAAYFYPHDTVPQEFEVVEGGGTQEVTLDLDPSAVDALLARTSQLSDELEVQPGETQAEHEQRVMQVILRENRR